MKKGFTLIELVLVMAIIGILASIGISSYTSTLQKARDARRKADITAIQTALEAYKQDNGTYPITSWVSSFDAQPWIPGLTSNYMKTIPVDPKNVRPLAPGAADQAGNYVYSYVSVNECGLADGSYYVLATRLENKNDSSGGKQTLLTSNCGWPAGGGVPEVYAVSSP